MTHGRTRPPSSRASGTAVQRKAERHGRPINDSAPVLVVEDDAPVREMICMLLTEAGIAARGAGTGEEGLRSAREQTPGLVLLDVHLPGVSGYEICRALREEFANSLPIVFVSGERTEPFDRVGGLLLGADDYITKPFAADELLARVRRLLQRAPPPVRRMAGQLTKRESQVLALLAQGMHHGAISSSLAISPKTVGTHIEHILLKLGVQSRAQAVAIAYRDGLVAPTGVEPVDGTAADHDP